MNHLQYHSVCNDTKWLELRDCMLRFPPEKRPDYRSKCISNGFVSRWDREWYYHFGEGGFSDIEWFELAGRAISRDDMMVGILQIGLTGERMDGSLRIYGYVRNGVASRKLSIEDFEALR